MGSVLEVGKIVTTVWLHTYWHQLRWLLKSYMSIAVAVLMFITSMGIFGFLSRAHIEVTSQAGGGELLIQQVELSISTEQKRIDDARAVIKQMDDAITGLLKGSGANAERDNNRTAAMTTQATKLRESQKKERETLNKSIDDSNKRIAELSKEKLKLKQEDLKLQAEVGPIKYIAQLIYDDELPGQSILEKAVRWVIIIIVAVFDPLAVAMVLGVTMVMNNRRRENELVEHEPTVPVRDSEGTRDIELPVGVERVVEVPVEVIREVEVIKEVPVEVIREVEVIKEVSVDVVREVLVEDTTQVNRLEEELAETLVMLEDALSKPAEVQYVDRVVEKTVEVIKEVPVEVIREVSVNDTTNLTALTRELDILIQENLRKENQIHALKAELKIKDQESAGVSADEFDDEVNTSLLGTQLPGTAEIGQLYLNIKTEKLYKYTGTDWLEVDKSMNTSYTLDEHWQNWKLGQMTRGESEWDDLTVAEQTALEQKAS
jgi:cell division septum initiation protein DivIVA